MSSVQRTDLGPNCSRPSGSDSCPDEGLQILPGCEMSLCQEQTWLQDQDCEHWGGDQGTWSARQALNIYQNSILLYFFSLVSFISYPFSFIQSFYHSVSLALIIEAALEAYFQFWLQCNYSLPDILSEDISLEQLATFRSFSILLSFITITVSIINIRFINRYQCICHIVLINSI